MPTINLKTQAGICPVVTGAMLADKLNRLLRAEVGAGKLFVVYDAQFHALHGRKLRQQVKLPSRQVSQIVIPSGEKIKTQRTLTSLHDFLLGEKISRSDFILACGGGVTTDIVGYAAATTLRGIRWGSLSTTLVGMVDAAIGGKTGLNHTLGKNLIGAFWQPRFVCSDVYYLGTLERRQMIAGLGEIVKSAGLCGEKLLLPLRKYLAADNLYDPRLLVPLISATAAFKGSVVTRDEREAGLRMILNFGHTFGHGIEKSLGFGRLLHGEAVILGISAAMRLGTLLGLDSKPLQAYHSLVKELMRRVAYRRLDADKIIEGMAWDKKRQAGTQKYVLLAKPGKPIIRQQITGRLIRKAVQEMLADYRISRGQNA